MTTADMKKTALATIAEEIKNIGLQDCDYWIVRQYEHAMGTVRAYERICIITPKDRDNYGALALSEYTNHSKQIHGIA